MSCLALVIVLVVCSGNYLKTGDQPYKALHSSDMSPDVSSANQDTFSAYFTRLAQQLKKSEMSDADSIDEATDMAKLLATALAGSQALSSARGTTYRVHIHMDTAAIKALVHQQLDLFVFKAVNADTAGYPVAWFKAGVLQEKMTISWTVRYDAYYTHERIVPGGTIKGVTARPAYMGQLMTVHLDGVAVEAGSPGEIGVYNKYFPSDTEYITGGLAEEIDGKSRPFCAFPVLYKFAVFMEPLQRIFLMWGSDRINTGAVLVQSVGPGMEVSLSGSARERTVAYGLKHGWLPQRDWATPRDPGADLRGMLIRSGYVNQVETQSSSS